MNYIVYKTSWNQELFPGKKGFYYGVHNGADENYRGTNCKVDAILNKHGVEALDRKTLMGNLTKEEAYELEEFIVDEEMIKNPDCWNLRVGGCGGFPPFYGEDNPAYGKGAFTGKKHSETTKEKMRVARKKQSPPIPKGSWSEERRREHGIKIKEAKRKKKEL